jgi:hypothetical protein
MVAMKASHIEDSGRPTGGPDQALIGPARSLTVKPSSP